MSLEEEEARIEAAKERIRRSVEETESVRELVAAAEWDHAKRYHATEMTVCRSRLCKAAVVVKARFRLGE